jgi:hypothetical protein
MEDVEIAIADLAGPKEFSGLLSNQNRTTGKAKHEDRSRKNPPGQKAGGASEHRGSRQLAPGISFVRLLVRHQLLWTAPSNAWRL